MRKPFHDRLVLFLVSLANNRTQTNYNQNCICAIIPNRLNIHTVHGKLSGTPNHLLHNDRGEILESAEIGVFSRIHEGIK